MEAEEAVSTGKVGGERMGGGGGLGGFACAALHWKAFSS